jgi:hypothetical protein
MSNKPRVVAVDVTTGWLTEAFKRMGVEVELAVPTPEAMLAVYDRVTSEDRAQKVHALALMRDLATIIESKPTKLIVIGNCMGAGVDRVEVVLGLGDWTLLDKTLIVWNDRPTTEFTAPYVELGFRHFASRLAEETLEEKLRSMLVP